MSQLLIGASRLYIRPDIMIASKLVSQIIAPLRTSDSGEEALTIMHVYHVKHLPIVNNEQLLGTISEEDILTHDLSEPIGSYGLSLIRGFVNKQDHMFEVMSRMAEGKMTTIPVVDEEENYIGLITQEALIHFYADSFSFKEPGSILVLEMDERDYSLAEISRIVESESISILSCFLTSEEQSTRVYVTIKLNTTDIHHVTASLERYDYVIKATYSEDAYYDDLKERYDALMSYLNV